MIHDGPLSNDEIMELIVKQLQQCPTPPQPQPTTPSTAPAAKTPDPNCTSGPRTMEVLMVGNSYTQYNNLKNKVRDYASANGYTLNIQAHTPEGETFSGHVNSAPKNKRYDVVVLQEQSLLPAFGPQQVKEDVLPFARQLYQKYSGMSRSKDK